MATLASLVDRTDKGIPSFKESPERATHVAELARTHGG
jgi:uncharacterized protein with GYD domain